MSVRDPSTNTDLPMPHSKKKSWSCVHLLSDICNQESQRTLGSFTTDILVDLSVMVFVFIFLSSFVPHANQLPNLKTVRKGMYFMQPISVTDSSQKKKEKIKSDYFLPHLHKTKHTEFCIQFWLALLNQLPSIVPFRVIMEIHLRHFYVALQVMQCNDL